MRTKFQFEKNGFDLIRYWAAISVMLLHFTGYWLILGNSGKEIIWIIRRIISFFPGVVVLFSLSGYLVSASMDRLHSEKLFFRKRVLRLYPELWLCTIVNLIVLFLLVPQLLDKSIVIWFFTQIIGIANTPGCLKEFATGSVNGALWTICVEIQLYVILGIFYKILSKLKDRIWYLLLAACALINVFFDFAARNMEGIMPKVMERLFFPYLLWFLIGVFCYMKRELVFRYRYMVLILLAAYVICGMLPIRLPGYYANIAVGILCPVIVVMGGYCLPSVRIKTDISYGLFLYHWIVLNVMVYFRMPEWAAWYVCLLIFAAASVFLAWGSRFLVKKFMSAISK